MNSYLDIEVNVFFFLPIEAQLYFIKIFVFWRYFNVCYKSYGPADRLTSLTRRNSHFSE